MHGTVNKKNTFLRLFISSQYPYMFRVLLGHLQEALHSCYLVYLRAYVLQIIMRKWQWIGYAVTKGDDFTEKEH
jgi:hypothetical protein